MKDVLPVTQSKSTVKSDFVMFTEELIYIKNELLLLSY